MQDTFCGVMLGLFSISLFKIEPIIVIEFHRRNYGRVWWKAFDFRNVANSNIFSYTEVSCVFEVCQNWKTEDQPEQSGRSALVYCKDTEQIRLMNQALFPWNDKLQLSFPSSWDVFWVHSMAHPTSHVLQFFIPLLFISFNTSRQISSALLVNQNLHVAPLSLHWLALVTRSLHWLGVQPALLELQWGSKLKQILVAGSWIQNVG